MKRQKVDLVEDDLIDLTAEDDDDVTSVQAETIPTPTGAKLAAVETTPTKAQEKKKSDPSPGFSQSQPNAIAALLFKSKLQTPKEPSRAPETSKEKLEEVEEEEKDEIELVNPVVSPKPVVNLETTSSSASSNKVGTTPERNGPSAPPTPLTPACSIPLTEFTKLSTNEAIRFLLLDCCVTFHPDRAPIIHLLGKTANGTFCHLDVVGFVNYFYAEPGKSKKEDLIKEKGVISVTNCQRAPLFFYRKAGEMRDMYEVRYSFNNKKDKPLSIDGRFETDIKLKRRFMTERKLGAGCTVRCSIHAKADESGKLIRGECNFDQVFREEDEDEEITCSMLRTLAVDIQRSHHPKRAITARCLPEKKDPLVCISCCSGGSENPSATNLFILASEDQKESVVHRQELCAGRLVTKHFFASEDDLISAFKDFLLEEDPDVLVGWDIVTHLETLQSTLRLSRLDSGIALKTKKVVNYSAAWVRRPNARMSGTSNQQTTKLTDGIEGRILIDLLRTTTTKHKMQRYSLAESIGRFLWQEDGTLRASPIAFAFEELDQPTISTLWREPTQRSKVVDFCFGRSVATLALTKKQSLVEETLQAGSTALLTLSEVIYGAQMVRVHSLLMRKMYETKRIAAGSTDRAEGVLQDPINAPFLINPDEVGTPGLYLDEPIAVLDFASLYPSVIIAFNLCYSTYVHSLDRHYFTDVPPPRKTGSATQLLTMAPAYAETAAVERHLFVTEQVRPGIVPQLLKELLQQRDEVKQRMADKSLSQDRRTILDQRQTQLKLSANATYGFIGATASPLSFVVVAESVLRWGQAICRRAVSTVSKQFPECKVIYGQTDSLFIALGKDTRPGKEAEAKAQRIADEITRSIGRPPIKIKFEKVYFPFILSGVNRYAGRLLNGELEIVGIESESRKECGLVRKVLRAFLHDVLIQRVDPFQYLPAFMDYSLPRTLPSDLVLTHALWRNTIGNGQSSSSSSAATAQSPVRNGGEPEAENQPHVQVARRICAHDEDVSFVLGQRVAFIFRNHPEFRKQADKARAPFEEQNVLPDLTLYVRNKLLPPLGRLARLIDLRKWTELESGWSQRTWTMSVCPRGSRKCFGKPGCRFLIKDSHALCDRCEEEGFTGDARAAWEKECNRIESQLYAIKRDRHRGSYLKDSIGKEYSALDVAHLVSELEALRKVLEERVWLEG